MKLLICSSVYYGAIYVMKPVFGKLFSFRNNRIIYVRKAGQ
jgi:hypothetical protein